jgi:hypothetical protein
LNRAIDDLVVSGKVRHDVEGKGGVTGPCLTHELPDICQMTWNLAGALGVWQKSLQHVLVMPNKSVCALRLGGR